MQSFIKRLEKSIKDDNGIDVVFFKLKNREKVRDTIFNEMDLIYTNFGFLPYEWPSYAHVRIQGKIYSLSWDKDCYGRPCGIKWQLFSNNEE